MGFKTILAGLGGRIFGRTPAAASEPLSEEEQLIRDYDLSLVEFHDEIPALIPQRDSMRAAWRNGDFAAYQ